ncbi:PIN2/TERF1-interacting telomerase inhibitor 1 isoform X2 [Pteropus alecto]|uniref:PIN2/TERF1-interacting telomerase inhibitor 1 isoform X2 n=1 Tax=Pteropus alecto TaxID=9402 RepID=UPI000D536315|nr:PIN2/TERF1-interacting telomerase inhibitor 1 isoform X2 [Pteropus alecto]
MSMLAERRRKQKWAVDPRNTAWSNDDSKFGQRMLEKMGWSKGKGLGAQEQGATDHIKVQVKNNHLGLGATINNEDNWIAHQDDFNHLLAELNTCHGQEKTGKDLSSRSKTDLDCIFGKRQSKKTPEDDSSPTIPDGDETSATTTSAFTIQEYFAKRMAELKNKPQVTAIGPETQMERKRGKKRKKTAKDNNVENYTQPKTKKKRDQVEQQLGDPRWGEHSSVSAEDGEDCVWPPDDQDLPQKPKKKREKKKLQKQVEAAVDATLDETPVKKKKKKRKDSK